MTKKSALMAIALVVSMIFINSCVSGGSAAAGTPVSATWAVLEAEEYTDAVVVEGFTSANPIKMEGVVYNSEKNGGARISTPDKTWTAMSGRDESMYVEFSVPVDAATIITNIAMQIGSSGTSNMQWDILYSTEADFSNPEALIERGSAGVKDALTTLDFADLWEIYIPVEAGKTFTLRVYPYYGSEGSGKYMMLKDVAITGIK